MRPISPQCHFENTEVTISLIDSSELWRNLSGTHQGRAGEMYAALPRKEADVALGYFGHFP